MDAAFFFEKAVQSMDRYHFDKALKYFRRAVDLEPNNPVNHCNMAGIMAELGQFQESNEVLQRILDEVDPEMTECYYYLANNYANMEDFEAAETALIRYLEKDPDGHFLEEAEEMMELLGIELQRPPKISTIKAKEGLYEHDKARAMLEEGRFAEAVRQLEKIVRKQPDFIAARNNLALAYYYLGHFEKAVQAIDGVLQADPGNLHALCNMAIFLKHIGNEEELSLLSERLARTVPYATEHTFKLATTMGILGRHKEAYGHFRRLLKNGENRMDPCLSHYAATAAYNMGNYAQAEYHWKQAEKLDPASDIPKFYLSQLGEHHTGASGKRPDIIVSYHYHLPFEEQFQLIEKLSVTEGIPEHFRKDPLVRSSFFWALRHGDRDTKLQVLQALSLIGDREVELALRDLLVDAAEDDYIKKMAAFILRGMGLKDPLPAVIGGKKQTIHGGSYAPSLPVWEEKWQEVMDRALSAMDKRYDMIQRHDLQTLWVEYLSRVYPAVPKLSKAEGWAAALEYLTAKMHRRSITYVEVAERYGASITTVSKNVKAIDEACGLREKMRSLWPKM
nr:tetratricopeptide repeat protein [Paenibacillus turpanensis]